jgi:hypothetical protein
MNPAFLNSNKEVHSMKGVILFFTIFILTISPSFGSDDWELQTTLMGSIGMGLDFIDHDTGWMAGAIDGLGPTIWNTTNGGATWNIQTSEMLTFFYLNIDMASELVGYAGGLASFFIMGPGAKTKDGGLTWEALGPMSMIQAWHDCFAFDDNHVWLSGMWTQLMKTKEGVCYSKNGGSTWNYSPWKLGDSPRYLWFNSTQTGWLSGGHWPEEECDGAYYRMSENDMRTFPMSPDLPRTTYNDYHGLVGKTTDGGETWTKLWETDHIYMNQIMFFDNQDGWMVGESGYTGYILHTSDGGHTWELAYQTNDHGLVEIQFVDRLHGWAFGFGPGTFNPKAAILQTTDGGITWERDDYKGPYGIYCASMVDRTKGWCAGANNLNTTGVVLYDHPGSGADVEIAVSNTPDTGHPGETVSWRITLKNNETFPVTVDVWLSISSDVLPPPLNPYDMVLVEDVTLPGGYQTTSPVSIKIPSRAPSGTYSVDNVAGSYPDDVFGSDSFVIDIF